MKERRYVLKGNLVYDNKTRKKMYPVGKWKKYQHVFYNYDDKCYNTMNEDNSKKSIEKFEKSQDLICKWDFNPQINGVVYAYYEDYKLMKDIIGMYVITHNGMV